MLSVKIDHFLQSDISPQYSAAELDPRFLHQELTYVSLIDQEEVHHRMTTDMTTKSQSYHSQSSRSQISPSRTPPSAGSFGIYHENLPGFIRSLPDSLTHEDIDYLHRKGALDIPSGSFLNALLNSYIQFVYPYMPATDLESIRGILTSGSASISILLLQAINFAAIAFVDMGEIYKAGFNSRRSCRKAFYNKAQVSAGHKIIAQ